MLLTSIVAVMLVGFTAAARPQADETTVTMSREVKGATSKALSWLAKQQNADGSWSESRYPHNTAITALSLLAFMSQGHLPGQGPYATVVTKGCRFLLASARAEDGFLIGSAGGNMYCHGMATLVLAELWGMSSEPTIKPTLVRAVDLIVRTQNDEGGWRYLPQPFEADVSVTIMQVMALRAAKNSGLFVPDETLKKAVAYILRCQDARTGGFNYMPKYKAPGFARTAAGICVLQLCGEYEAKQIPKGVTFLQEHFNPRNPAQDHFWYGHYYAAHAMHQIGGKTWARWYENISKLLVSNQAETGDWSLQVWDGSSAGPVYQTAIAVIVLSVPTGFLPIFQR